MFASKIYFFLIFKFFIYKKIKRVMYTFDFYETVFINTGSLCIEGHLEIDTRARIMRH